MRLARVAGFVCVWMVALSLSAATRLVTTAGTDAGDCTVAPCATLSYAIGQAVSGDTIDVGPGTFTNGGNPINVDKTLIVAGEQFGVDARTRAATESVLTAPVVLAANNVVLDGFRVTCGNCVGVQASFLFSGHHVRNNIITGNGLGISLANVGPNQAVVQFNWVFDNNVPGVGGDHNGLRGNAAPADILIDQNLFANHDESHIFVTPAVDIVITNNELINAGGPWGAIFLASTLNGEIRGNVISGGSVGITNGGGNDTVQITENLVNGVSTFAMLFREAPSGSDFNTNVTVTNNQFINSGTGVRLEEAQVGGWEIHFNRIVGNAIDVATTFHPTIVANLENNWWGCNEGPATCATISNPVSAVLDLDPWLVMDIAANPSTISIAQTSAVTSDFNQNSNGAAVAGFPDGVVVSFSATNGSMTPPTAPTSGGAATSTFTPAALGNATASAMLDDETVSANITVLLSTTVGLTSSQNPSTFGQAVTFTATVNPAATGSITFLDGVTPLATVPIAAGTAQLTISTLTVGSHIITAQYSGDGSFAPATSAPLTQFVNGVAIPTLSETMLMLLAIAIAAAAFVTLRSSIGGS